MNLTQEEKIAGRRNFLKALAGTPALGLLGAPSAAQTAPPGGPVRLGFVGLGTQGLNLLGRADPAVAQVQAVCDINPQQLAKADALLARRDRPPAPHYVEWREMLEKEKLEGVVIASPLWLHAEMTSSCLEAGKHVLCEKMMAWDKAGSDRMIESAKKSGLVLEIGYQRFYSPLYQAAYSGIVRAGVLGDVYHARLVWHRNQNWRRPLPSLGPDYDPSRWGYPTLEHLINWRLYWRYSKGLLAELGSHQVNVANWFFDAAPEAVQSTGSVSRFQDGREVYDHVYSMFEYPNGRTALFTSVESSSLEDFYEMFMGTKGTLIMSGERNAYLLPERGVEAATTVETVRKADGPAAVASETRPPEDKKNAPADPSKETIDSGLAYRYQITAFCAAIRERAPLACGAERARHSSEACIRANEAIASKTRLTI